MRMPIAAFAGLAISCGLAASAVQAQDRAQEDGYGYKYTPDGDSGLPNYAGLRGSLALSTSVHSTIPSTPPANLRGSFGTGSGGSVYVGTRLPAGFRIELEALYRHLPISSAALNGSAVTAGGYGQMAAPMVNLMWDLPVPDFPFRPFIGAGIGYAWTETSLHSVGGATATTYLHSDQWKPVYNAIAGFSIPTSQSSRITGMYRWLHENNSFACGASGAASSKCKANFSDNSFDLGLEMDL